MRNGDDVDFGAAGSVAVWTEQGINVTYCIVTDGEAGGSDPSVPRTEMASIRRAEQMTAAECVGVSDVRFLGYPDGRLQCTLDLRRDISRVIRQVQPQRVVSQSPRLADAAPRLAAAAVVAAFSIAAAVVAIGLYEGNVSNAVLRIVMVGGLAVGIAVAIDRSRARVAFHPDVATVRHGLAMSVPADAGAGWHPDPERPNQRRWWDGAQWAAPMGFYHAPNDREPLRWWDGVRWTQTTKRPKSFLHYVVLVAAGVGWFSWFALAAGITQEPCGGGQRLHDGQTKEACLAKAAQNNADGARLVAAFGAACSIAGLILAARAFHRASRPGVHATPVSVVVATSALGCLALPSLFVATTVVGNGTWDYRSIDVAAWPRDFAIAAVVGLAIGLLLPAGRRSKRPIAS